jgi:L-amino acid N-acyltransferase YncA
MHFPIETRLKDGSLIQLVLADQRDVEPMQRLYKTIVEEGTSYPHERVPDGDEFEEYWFRGKTTIAAYVPYCRGTDPLGAFYLKPNWPGRARHVANAGFIVAPQWRNKGLGWLLGAVMLDYARDLGYRSVLFNLVFSENSMARHLWKKLGFVELGIIPGAVRKNDGAYQDAVIMFQSLIENKRTGSFLDHRGGRDEAERQK